MTTMTKTTNISNTTSTRLSDIQPWWVQDAEAPPIQPVKGVHCEPLQVIYVPLESLRCRDDDGYRMDEEQVVYLARSICIHGWCQPILIDQIDVILSGRARVDAAIALKLGVVPAIRITTRSAWQTRLVMSVENLLAGDRGWQRDEFEQEAKTDGDWQAQAHVRAVSSNAT